MTELRSAIQNSSNSRFCSTMIIKMYQNMKEIQVGSGSILQIGKLLFVCTFNRRNYGPLQCFLSFHFYKIMKSNYKLFKKLMPTLSNTLNLPMECFGNKTGKVLFLVQFFVKNYLYCYHAGFCHQDDLLRHESWPGKVFFV